MDVRLHDGLREVIAEAVASDAACYFFTKFGARRYSDVSYAPSDYLVFGKETTGLPDYVHREHAGRLLRFPMGTGVRSLNLSNTVAIAVYEALRQQGFPDLT